MFQKRNDREESDSLYMDTIYVSEIGLMGHRGTIKPIYKKLYISHRSGIYPLLDCKTCYGDLTPSYSF